MLGECPMTLASKDIVYCTQSVHLMRIIVCGLM